MVSPGAHTIPMVTLSLAFCNSSRRHERLAHPVAQPAARGGAQRREQAAEYPAGGKHQSGVRNR
jgi:hypothetical protein